MSHAFFFNAKKSTEFRLNLTSLYDLYLPIIGQSATNFYMLLNNMVEANVKNNNLTFNSNLICRQLNVSTDELVSAKEKLEAIGLLSTYVSTNINKDNIFILVLNSCLDYETFISNPKFKTLLINQIGTTNFEYLEYKFMPEQDLQEAIEVSVGFDKVFNNEQLKDVSMVNFESLYKNIQKTTSLPIVINDNCKQIIEDVYAKYQLSLHDIEMVIYDSINEVEGHLEANANLLIQNFNKFISGKVNISLINVNRDFKLFYGQLNQEQENKIINDYKVCNAELYLCSIFKRSLSREEKNIIATLRGKYYLNDEIINVLVDFSLNKTNGKLNKKYLTKAANSINGLGLINAAQVINHFKKALIDNTVSFEKEETALESI